MKARSICSESLLLGKSYNLFNPLQLGKAVRVERGSRWQPFAKSRGGWTEFSFIVKHHCS